MSSININPAKSASPIFQSGKHVQQNWRALEIYMAGNIEVVVVIFQWQNRYTVMYRTRRLVPNRKGGFASLAASNLAVLGWLGGILPFPPILCRGQSCTLKHPPPKKGESSTNPRISQRCRPSPTKPTPRASEKIALRHSTATDGLYSADFPPPIPPAPYQSPSSPPLSFCPKNSVLLLCTPNYQTYSAVLLLAFALSASRSTRASRARRVLTLPPWPCRSPPPSSDPPQALLLFGRRVDQGAW
ncbi:hypothetical protein CISG_00047 [Coccidioides immitis RMSCC 3703]|uniref:Uncharacterized protein n=1 Tax=Coccidioides immitis RMSCC 3703 TaxID=454286 RepID=A0A0J8TDZ8_COCIT|nr:hypothetical protein CISG_00047 [Coccidioides immitis RMSCC 3703]